jgi:hypothetical protein
MKLTYSRLITILVVACIVILYFLIKELAG